MSGREGGVVNSGELPTTASGPPFSSSGGVGGHAKSSVASDTARASQVVVAA